MTQTFDCPKCGAPVPLSNTPIGRPATVQCTYCGSVLAEPVPSLGRPAQIIQVKFEAPTGFRLPKSLLLILVIPLLGLVAAGIAVGVGLSPFLRSTPKGKTTSTPPRQPGPMGGIEKPPSFANVLLSFGSEGIGPGLFKDARSIAVDGNENIYVGDYTGGRLQVFDSSGNFITQWSVDPKMPLRGIAADRKGTVYVVQSGVITRFEGSSGNKLGQFAYGEGWGFDDVVSTPDGGIVAAWYKNRDDIVRFNSAGQPVRIIKAAISTASGDSELNTRVTIDGLGNIFALGTFNNAVFKFGPDGKFLTRFGGQGNQEGQFNAASAIAVDGRGRVYVSDSKGIQIFDGNGRFLRVFKPEAYALGMTFNDRNELFIAARTKVLKLALAE